MSVSIARQIEFLKGERTHQSLRYAQRASRGVQGRQSADADIDCLEAAIATLEQLQREGRR